MSQVTRRAVLGAAAGTALVGFRAQPARAAEFSYKFANNLPATHPLNLRAVEASQRILEATKGRLEIKVFPSNQLGSDTDVLTQLRSGAVEFFTLSGLILSTLVPVASINGVGFAFKSYDQVWPAMDGPLGGLVRDAVAKKGLLAMEKIWDNGFRQVTTSTKPIVTPADFAGLKIRVPVSPLWTSLLAALGASPTSINLTEVYSALQTHIVDAQENPLAVIETVKFFEVQKYCSMTNHMWDGYWFLANKKAWDALPEDVREIAAREINRSAMDERADVAALNASLRGKLTEQGLTFNDPDTAAFREVLKKAGFYRDWRAKYGEDAWKVLEGAVGSLS